MNLGRINMSKLEDLAKRSGIKVEELHAELEARGLKGVAFITGTIDPPLPANNS
jgi:hypothetical protein